MALRLDPAQMSFAIISGGRELSCASDKGVGASTSFLAGLTTFMADLDFLA
jgi:hypothetical protein